MTKDSGRQWFMLTVVGGDQPGIVAGLTQALYQGGVALGEATMARLAGNFTMMLTVHSPLSTEATGALIEPLARRLGLRFHIDPVDARLHTHLEPNLHVVVHGADRPGIVAEVTQILAGQGVNILDLDSDVAGTEAQPIYVMIIEAFSPEPPERVDAALAPVRASGIDVRVTPIDTLIG